MISDFKRRAQHALFFVPIKKIKASYPGQYNQYQESWVVEKSTKGLPDFSGAVDIHCHDFHKSKLQQWSVLFKTIPLQDIPSNFHECLSTHKLQTISIGIAGALKTPPSHHRPFFGLPLLDTISLPIHLHCTFILSDDRRSIRYDEKGTGNPESEFNKWLLTEKVPLLYLQFLKGWDQVYAMEECPWWPRGGQKDILSRAVFKAMEIIFPTSDDLVCDTYSGNRIAPSEAHFLQPSCPKGLLLALLPRDLAIIPSGFSHLLSLQNVDSDYLITILQHNQSSIISMYKEGRITVGDVVDVARFLKLSSLPNSIGLPLLPLADGTLASLSTKHTTFYHPSLKQKNPFPLHHFLDPKATKERTIYDSLQVCDLDSTAISRLIMVTIPEQNTFYSSPAQEVWLEELWELLKTTQVAIEDSAFHQLPLIPTYNPETSTRISFQKLAGNGTIFIDHHTTLPLDACVALGITIIKASDCPGRLSAVIRSRKEQSSGIHRGIISFFMDLPRSEIPRRFQRLDHELHLKFSQWFQRQLSGSYRFLPKTEKAIVQDIPLWETIRVGLAPARFVSASMALVIPEGIDPGVVQTWTSGSTAYVPADDFLSLMNKPAALPTFYVNHLSFPSIMNPVTRTYKSLLEKVLRSSTIPQSSILVPNANGRMSSSSKLYLSSNTTFANSFASQNGMFLHPNLRDLEPLLCHWGLIDVITAQSFIACALAIHQDINRRDIPSRALIVFGTYNTEMPPKLLSDHGSQNALRNVRFIPRRLGSTRYGSIPTDRYHSLPNIVSPSEILDPKYVRVAWTQRAACLEEPSDELRLVNNSAWKPEAPEVVGALFFTPLLTSHSLLLDQTPSHPCHRDRTQARIQLRADRGLEGDVFVVS